MLGLGFAVANISLVVRAIRKCLQSTNRSNLQMFLKESFTSFQVSLLNSITFMMDKPDNAVAEFTYNLLEVILVSCVRIGTKRRETGREREIDCSKTEIT